jgi:hypothetical protein
LRPEWRILHAVFGQDPEDGNGSRHLWKRAVSVSENDDRVGRASLASVMLHVPFKWLADVCPAPASDTIDLRNRFECLEAADVLNTGVELKNGQCTLRLAPEIVER